MRSRNEGSHPFKQSNLKTTTTMPQKSVFCFATSRTQAGQIVDQLKAASFSSNDISALFADHPTSRHFAQVKHTKAPEGAIVGVGIGGALGWIAGIGVLVIPGFGPFMDASPILAVLSGVAMGAAVGSMAGGLIGLGFPKFDAQRHEDKPRDGDFLISVHTGNAAEIAQAEVIFTQAEARDNCTTEEAAVADDERVTEILIYPITTALKDAGTR